MRTYLADGLLRDLDPGFVLVERVGTSSNWRVNERCLSCFPSAAEVVMGRIDTEFTDAMEAAT